MAAQMRRLPSRYSITFTIVLALVAMFAVNATLSNAQDNGGGGLPANKVAAAGSDIDTLGAGEGPQLVMSETMKVSTKRDLMLHLSAECAILTRLNTAGGPDSSSETDFAFGQVKMFIAIDGKRVPVATDDTSTDLNGDTDAGEVVFCNRAYQRSVTDAENEQDGIDGENDYLRTRSANAFTWLALDAGLIYDDPANGNNVIQVDVFAEYDTRASEDGTAVTPSCEAPAGEATPIPAGGPTCADAFIGSRTLVVDTDVAANDEQVAPGTEASPYPARP